MVPAGTRPVGAVTRGTTHPNRLRRMDWWIAHRTAAALRGAEDPLVVDLGFGASPVTTLELAERLCRAAGRPVPVVGLEIDAARVAAAAALARPHVNFALGGFEVATPRPPLVIRAANVLRQYDESDVAGAWAGMARRLAKGGVLVEGTCDELGRLGAWVTIPAAQPTRPGAPEAAVRRARAQRARPAPVARPESLTLGVDLRSLHRPSDVAERLPKALIHRNVPGEPVHALLEALDSAWHRAAGVGAFGARQRWLAAVADLKAGGIPVRDGPARWRLGELTVPWGSVSPRA